MVKDRMVGVFTTLQGTMPRMEHLSLRSTLVSFLQKAGLGLVRQSWMKLMTDVMVL